MSEHIAEHGAEPPKLFAKKVCFDDDGNMVGVIKDYGLVAGGDEIEMSPEFQQRISEFFGDEESAEIYATARQRREPTLQELFIRQTAPKGESPKTESEERQCQPRC